MSTSLHSQPGLNKPEPSITPLCPYFYQCGGCDSQDVPYDQQVAAKSDWLMSLFAPVISPESWRPYLSSPDQYPHYFRNKIRFSFVEENGVIFPSRHAKGDENADIPVELCYLQSDFSNALIRFTALFAQTHGWTLYNPGTGSGWLKHILIREGKRTGEALVTLVTNTGSIPAQEKWVSELTTRFPTIRCITHTETWGKSNEQQTDQHLWGASGIHEKVGDFQFFISPHAFFQTNSEMVETLYATTRAACLDTNPAYIWDLYAGSATIGIYMSKDVKRIVSIESNPANIRDALRNCELNHVENVTLTEGSVEKILTSAFIRENGMPDSIVVDPPRSGLSSDIKYLLPNLKEHSLTYVSCNPLTCLRDCQELVRKGYTIQHAQGIDMFPHTWHSEMVVQLKK